MPWNKGNIMERYKINTVFEAENKWQPQNKARFLVLNVTGGNFSGRFEILCLHCTAMPERIGKILTFYEYQLHDQEEKNHVTFVPEEPEREWLIGLQEIAVSIDDSAWFNSLKNKIIKNS